MPSLTLMETKDDLGTAMNLALNRKMATKIASSGFLRETAKVAVGRAR